MAHRVQTLDDRRPAKHERLCSFFLVPNYFEVSAKRFIICWGTSGIALKIAHQLFTEFHGPGCHAIPEALTARKAKKVPYARLCIFMR
jgi:hypothetical protein